VTGAVVRAAAKRVLVLALASACGSSGPPSTVATLPGGSGGGGDASSSGDLPACATPNRTSTDPPPLGNVAGVLDASGALFVAFGGDAAVPACGQPPLQHDFRADTFVLDLGCGTWSKIGSASSPSARARQAMALDPAANRALLFGGRSSAGGVTYQTYADVWAFDFATSAWTQVQTAGAAPSGRANSAAVVDTAGDRLVVFGGNTSTTGTALLPQGDTWALDLKTGAWKSLAAGGAHPPAREYHAMAVDPDARIAYLFGGGDASAFTGPFLSDVWAFDLATESWKEVPTTGAGPGGRIEGALLFDTAGRRLVAFGGHDDGLVGNENDIFVLDLSRAPAAWSKLALGDTPGAPSTGPCAFPPDFTHVDMQSPERRSAFAFAPRVDGRGMVVFAGASDCGLLADAWWWSGPRSAWTPVRASPVGLSCLRVETSCRSLCG
jgi:hypothetical protein